MDFDSLWNISLPEELLVERIVRLLQNEFDAYQHACYFFKIERIGDFPAGKGMSHIVWMKEFETIQQIADFLYETPYEKAMFNFKFEDDHYAIHFNGYEKSIFLDVWPDRFLNISEYKKGYDIEKEMMVPRSIIIAAFGEITQTLSKKVAVMPMRRKKVV